MKVGVVLVMVIAMLPKFVMLWIRKHVEFTTLFPAVSLPRCQSAIECGSDSISPAGEHSSVLHVCKFYGPCATLRDPLIR